MVRKIAFIAGAALLGMSAAGAANANDVSSDDPMLTGTLEVFGGYRFLNENGTCCVIDDTETPLVGVSGKVNIPVYGRWSVQVDGLYEHYFPSMPGGNWSEDPESVITGIGHLNWRDSSRGLVGIFGGYGWTNVYENNGNFNDDADTEGFVFGAEGQVYLGHFTLYGQAGFTDVRSNNCGGCDPEGLVDAYFWRTEGRYFIEDDTQVEFSVGKARTNRFIDGSDAGFVLTVGVEAKTRLAEFDFGKLYGGVGWRVTDADSPDEDDSVHDHAVFASLSFQFNSNSLKANDRLGATLDSPVFLYRGAAWTEAID
jgi:hypothetical protein